MLLLHELVRLNAEKRPDAPALVYDGETLTFAALLERTHRLAGALASLAAPGDRVAILSENRAEYIECLYGVPAAGMSLMLLNFRLNPRELVRIVNDSEPTVLITEPAYLPTVEAIRVELPSVRHVVVAGGEAADDLLAYEELLAAAAPEGPELDLADDALAWLIYTSGTTGMPKGAMLTHRNLLAGTMTSALVWDRDGDSTMLFPWPLCHVAAYSIMVSHLFGDAVVLLRAFDPEQLLATIERHRVTRTTMAPTMLNMLLDHPALERHDLSSLRSIGYGAASMPAETLRRAMARFPGMEFSTGFGMTELSGNVMYFNDAGHQRALAGDVSKLGSVGQQMPLATVRVVDDDLRDVAVGEVGEIVVRGPQVTVGYWGRPEATAEAFAGGWFHSGDLGRWDEEGNLYIVDRKKDMVLTGGENVYSREVEEVLYRHEGVAEAAIIGVPDERWGENVVAVVQRRAGAEVTGDELIAFCKDHLASYKKPKQVIFVPELPKNAAGKILKRELRDRVRDGELA
jgi:acyl-CoA synthetase (AMP-forming)/AMP-acid ligase II